MEGIDNKKVVSIDQKKFDKFVESQVEILFDMMDLFERHGISDPDEIIRRLGNILSVLETPDLWIDD